MNHKTGSYYPNNHLQFILLEFFCQTDMSKAFIYCDSFIAYYDLLLIFKISKEVVKFGPWEFLILGLKLTWPEKNAK